MRLTLFHLFRRCLGTLPPDLHFVVAASCEAALTRDIPVVLMTSLQESTVRDRASEYRGYLRKPFREVELMQAIGEILPRP
jgi:CheY-like chemotaxis protein